MSAALAALISGVLSLAGVIITIRKSNSETLHKVELAIDATLHKMELAIERSDAQHDKENALLRSEVDELMREVRAHNNFAQRMPVVESEIETIKDEISDMKRGK